MADTNLTLELFLALRELMNDYGDDVHAFGCSSVSHNRKNPAGQRFATAERCDRIVPVYLRAKGELNAVCEHCGQPLPLPILPQPPVDDPNLTKRRSVRIRMMVGDGAPTEPAQ